MITFKNQNKTLKSREKGNSAGSNIDQEGKTQPKGVLSGCYYEMISRNRVGNIGTSRC